MTTYDAIVVGLGGMGSAAVHQLASRGARVLGLDRFGPAHDRGSSHGGSRIVRQSYFEDPRYVPLLQRSFELFEAAQHDAGEELMRLTGGLYVGAEESETFAGSRAAAREWDLPHEELDASSIRKRFPTLEPADHHVGLLETGAGFARPEATVAAQLELAARSGATLRFDEPVERWAPDGDGVVVHTASGEVLRADRLVLSPGAWAPALLANLGLPLVVERLVQHWFAPIGGVGRFVDHPVWIAESDDTTQLYGFPAIDGEEGGVKVAFFRRSTPADPDDLDRTVAAGEIAEIEGELASIVPTLAGRHLDGVPCMYTTTPDHHFVVATHPAHDAVSIACGFSGHGFKFVPVIGEVLADLTIDGATDHPIELFDPARFAA